MIAVIALMLSLSSTTTPAADTTLNSIAVRVPAAATAGDPVCDEDCRLGTIDHRWHCVEGDVGYGCEEYSNGCGFTNCGGTTLLVDAGGILRQVAMCSSSLTALRDARGSVEARALFEDAVDTGLLTVRASKGELGSSARLIIQSSR